MNLKRMLVSLEMFRIYKTSQIQKCFSNFKNKKRGRKMEKLEENQTKKGRATRWPSDFF